MLRYRRGALGRTQKGTPTMQQDNLTILTPPREAALAFCARLRHRRGSYNGRRKSSGPRLFKA